MKKERVYLAKIMGYIHKSMGYMGQNYMGYTMGYNWQYL